MKFKQDIAPSAFAMMEFKEVLVSLEAAINAREINREEIEGQIIRLKILLKKNLPRDEQAEHLDNSAKKSAQEMRDRAFRSWAWPVIS